MAKLIKADGSVIDVEPKDGAKFTFDELQEIVGGRSAFFLLETGNVWIVNRDWEAKDLLPVNAAVTKVLSKVALGCNVVVAGEALLLEEANSNAMSYWRKALRLLFDLLLLIVSIVMLVTYIVK